MLAGVVVMYQPSLQFYLHRSQRAIDRPSSLHWRDIALLLTAGHPAVCQFSFQPRHLPVGKRGLSPGNWFPPSGKGGGASLRVFKRGSFANGGKTILFSPSLFLFCFVCARPRGLLDTILLKFETSVTKVQIFGTIFASSRFRLCLELYFRLGSSRFQVRAFVRVWVEFDPMFSNGEKTILFPPSCFFLFRFVCTRPRKLLDTILLKFETSVTKVQIFGTIFVSFRFKFCLNCILG